MLTFLHEFEEQPRWGEISDELYETPAGARIAFFNAENGIWLTANSEGFLHLARIFAELGTRNFGEGYHFHRSEWLKQPAAEGQEVSVEIHNGDWTADA